VEDAKTDNILRPLLLSEDESIDVDQGLGDLAKTASGRTRHNPQSAQRWRAPSFLSCRRKTLLLGVVDIIFMALWIHFRVIRIGPHDPTWPRDVLGDYTPVKFTGGFGTHTTVYMGGPSLETDQAWEELWSKGLSTGKTTPGESYTSQNEQPVSQLGVFHHLHCLDTLRHALHPLYFPNSTIHISPLHGPVSGGTTQVDADVDYCIEVLRQTLICASDVSLIVWNWVESDGEAHAVASNWHTCRNWEKLVEWVEGGDDGA